MADPTDAELLSLVKSALSGTLTRAASQMTIAGRTITSFSLTELITLRNDLEQRIRLAAGTARPLVARFRKPT